jgi:hypothetical protein
MFCASPLGGKQKREKSSFDSPLKMIDYSWIICVKMGHASSGEQSMLGA